MPAHSFSDLWIVVANQTEARIFSRGRPSEGLQLVEKFEHPKGRLQDHDIGTDQPGRSFGMNPSSSEVAYGGKQRIVHGLVRHGFAPRTPLHLAESIRFARKLGQYLETARSQNRFSNLILVAGPEELGMLRRELSALTSKQVIASLNKNLSQVRDQEIEDQIWDVLSETDQSRNLRTA